MKKLFYIALLFSTIPSFAQSIAGQHKPKNLIIISLDGYRWKEIFQGADSLILFNKKYMPQDSGLIRHSGRQMQRHEEKC